MVRPRVYSLAVELTPACNQKCDYCYNEWREDGGASVETGERDKLFRRVERILAAWELDHVTLTGGEPFARSDIFELLELLSRHGVPVQIISNGGLIDDAIAARLVQHRVRYVQLTLNGPNAELHEAHVGRGWFEKTLAGIRALQRQCVPIGGCIVITKKNHARVGEILGLWQELGVTQVALSRFSPAGYAVRHAAQLLPSRAELITAFEQALPFARDRGLRLISTMPAPPCAVEVERFSPIQFGSCPIGTALQEFALGPDGALHNCTLHRAAIGAVKDVADPAVDLVALLQSVEVTGYRRELPEFCRGCLHASTCGGGCGAAAEWTLGHARLFADPFVMQHIDDDFAERLARQRRSRRTHLEVIL